MKKLTDEQIKFLLEKREKGIKEVYAVKNQYYNTTYVKIFNVDRLLEDGCLPSYWYNSHTADYTLTEVLKKNMYRLPR